MFNTLQFQDQAMDIYRDAADLTYDAAEIDTNLGKDKETLEGDKQKVIYRVSCIENRLRRLKEQVLSL